MKDDCITKIRNEITDIQTYLLFTGEEGKIDIDTVLDIIDYYTGDTDG